MPYITIFIAQNQTEVTRTFVSPCVVLSVSFIAVDWLCHSQTLLITTIITSWSTTGCNWYPVYTCTQCYWKTIWH